VTGATSKPSLSARARQQSTPSPACVCSSDFVGSPNAALTFLIPSFPLRKRKKEDRRIYDTDTYLFPLSNLSLQFVLPDPPVPPSDSDVPLSLSA
jgi:hypothetical protein